MNWKIFIKRNLPTFFSVGMFLTVFAFYLANHPAGLTPNVLQTSANKGAILAFIAMAQAVVVLTGGIDLSVGMIFVLTNCVASYLLGGSSVEVGLGVVAVLLVGMVCGAVNGLIVVFGRLQPIVATIATGSLFFGAALWLRPYPGTIPDFSENLADLLTGKVFGLFPASFVLLALVLFLIWMPFKATPLGRTIYAIGSSEDAAYMSGMPIRLAKFAAFVTAGLFAAIGGIFLTCVTYSGEASLANGNNYTLFSIAAVVLGGVSLYGGTGSVVGVIFGALAFRAIGDLLFVFDLDPLWQPLFQGLVLAVAISFGAGRLFNLRNRLELFS
ncbi:ABC transporter permease [Falsihalocynthiibacter arcticus]|uniref:ABC transporter permease n=1 Tax=Falsihalocynthiibacter arcticus TaxID=1579316 RepID=UPI003002CA8B